MRVFLLALLLTCSSRAFADTLWAVDGNSFPNGSSVSHLWQINTATGAATLGVTLATTAAMGDITFLNGTMYGGAYNAGVGFSTIDPVTGVVTVINSADPVQGLAVNPSIPLFYEDGNVGSGFNTITPAGSRTVIGGGGENDFVTDLAYDSVHNVLFGWSHNQVLLKIDPATGQFTLNTRPFGPGPRLSGAIGYDWANQTLYFLDANNDNLYSFNTTTGAPTLIGPTGVTGVNFRGLADLPTPSSAAPEPSTAALIAMGVAAFVLFRSRLR